MSDPRPAAVVTGAASGIGRALALEAASRGMCPAIADIDVAGLGETAALLAERGAQALTAEVDVRDASAMAAFADACFARFDTVGLVCANSGVIAFDSAVTPDLAAWDRMIDVNLRGVIHTVSAFANRLVAQGTASRVMITGSQTAFVGSPGLGAYAATKAALWSLADALRDELAQGDAPVAVSFLAPPAVLTGMASPTIDRLRARGGEAAVEGYLSHAWTPEAVARFALDAAGRDAYLIVPGNMVADAIAARMRSLVGA